MPTGTLPFSATCTSAIPSARSSIMKRTAGLPRTTTKSPNGLPTFVTTEANRRSTEAKIQPRNESDISPVLRSPSHNHHVRRFAYEKYPPLFLHGILVALMKGGFTTCNEYVY